MTDFKNKNDYTAIVFYEDKQRPPYKETFVHNCYAYTQWLTNSRLHQDWAYINFYVRRSQVFIQRCVKGQFCSAKPTI